LELTVQLDQQVQQEVQEQMEKQEQPALLALLERLARRVPTALLELMGYKEK
jgi:hypothetical protein